MSRQKVWFHWILLIVMMFSFSSTSTASAQDEDETTVYYIPMWSTWKRALSLRGPAR